MTQNYLLVLQKLNLRLPKKELDYIHAKSIYNFLIYYENLQGEDIRKKVLYLIEDYFSEIEKNEYLLTIEKSRELYSKYIMKIGQYYNHQLGFKGYMGWNAALFVGVVIDLALLLFGLLKRVYYLPIATLFFIGYNRYIFYAKRNKLYGPQY